VTERSVRVTEVCEEKKRLVEKEEEECQEASKCVEKMSEPSLEEGRGRCSGVSERTPLLDKKAYRSRTQWTSFAKIDSQGQTFVKKGSGWQRLSFRTSLGDVAARAEARHRKL